MALVVLPEGTQISGSAGGTTWSHNRFGAYKRNRSVPVNPNTDRQVAIRNLTRALSIAWATELTQAQRDAWELYAANVSWVNKLGQSVLLTGLNHFVRSNASRQQAGLARVDAGPVIFTLAPAELALVVTASEATQLLSVVYDDALDWCDEDGAFQSVFMGLPKNGCIKFFGGPWRFADVIEGDSVTPPTSPASIAVPFPIAEGQRIWVQTRIGFADGRLSEFARYNFLVAA